MSSLVQSRPKPVSLVELRKLLMGDDVYGTTLLVLANDVWGTECFDWHPRALRMEMAARYHLPQLPLANMNKLMAAIAIAATDLFFTNLHAFIEIANGLSGDLAPGVFDIADSLECAWAITEGLLLHSPDDDDKDGPFSTEIRHYLAKVVREEGYVRPPDVLRIAIGADVSQQVAQDLADDPELFQAVTEMQLSKSNEVEETLRENLLEMLTQLRSLPLRNGSTQKIEQHIQMLTSLHRPR